MSRLVRITWIPVLVVALYTGWVLWRRHVSQAEVMPVTRDPLAQYGTRVKIVKFYAPNGTIVRGEKALLCYGVVNAKEVRLEPTIEKVWPALSRCFDVAPRDTTRYTLTAQGKDQKVDSASLEIAVRQ